MRQFGAEWLYRLYREPCRLARRYLIRDVPYTFKLLLHSVLNGLLNRGDTCE
jgi:UDP-N-acetyl-D-mannosaminuronic acid transferase (WecB/TagA/CpsF family)